VQFDRLGVFSYSDEETSGSYHLDGKVDKRTIYARKRKLMAIQRRISLQRNKQLIGRELPVLVEGPSQETDLLWQARLATQAPEIDGLCYINDFGPGEPRPGEMRVLRVTKAHDYDLVGELVDVQESRYAAPQAANPFPILHSHPAHVLSIR
jgi:ribosomal protein S12 methylthiotransferase